MNNDTKSVAYAFISNGVQIYMNDDEVIMISKLVCSECGDFWYMNLTECFLCGAINSFLFKCADCGSFQSITKSSSRCSECGGKNIFMSCANPDCVSNTDENILKEANSFGGSLNKNSGLIISQQYCLKCGSQNHEYKNFKLLVRTVDSVNLDSKSLLLPEKNDSEIFVLFRVRSDDTIQYSVKKISQISATFKLDGLMTSFKDVVSFFYSS
jgi:DNA-directed RNA polymerase subunit RPC12/RpoP